MKIDMGGKVAEGTPEQILEAMGDLQYGNGEADPDKWMDEFTQRLWRLGGMGIEITGETLTERIVSLIAGLAKHKIVGIYCGACGSLVDGAAAIDLWMLKGKCGACYLNQGIEPKKEW